MACSNAQPGDVMPNPATERLDFTTAAERRLVGLTRAVLRAILAW